GLDKSWLEQYWLYVRNVFHGDLGTSFHFRQPVIDLYTQRFIPTLTLCGLAMLLSMAISIPLGVIAALKKNRPAGFLIQSAAFLGYAVPNFVLAILLILVFSFHLGWLPSSGSDTMMHYIMPVTALACTLIASLTRFSRSALLDVLSQDYIRTARAKGVGNFSVLTVHGLRNAMITIVTVLGLQVAALVSGSVVIENVFSWPGIGELLVFAAIKRDYPLLQTGVILVGTIVIFINFIVDVVYVLIDPRIQPGS
ncbi:MAG TPA: ABC transporter permease, partial [Synergistaceae bacterium]|nr:ABC transporter permease [Synergistaceae bacterium]